MGGYVEKHKVNISKKEFQRLQERFPQAARFLESIAEVCGPKVIIPLDLLRNREGVDEEVVTYLYRTSYTINEDRFLNYYYQVNEILKLPKNKVSSILHVGPGTGLFDAMIKNYDYEVTSLDVNADYHPDIVGNVLDLPLEDKIFDLICAFQVLEHMPFNNFEIAIKEMVRCARHYIYISLPCPGNYLFFQFNLQIVQRFLRRFPISFKGFLHLPTFLPDQEEKVLLERSDYGNPHYWEVNRKSYPKGRIKGCLESLGARPIKTFHNKRYPYCYFILCEVTK